MIAAISEAWLLPSKAFRRSPSRREERRARRCRVRASASLPSSCSGAMYWNVPRIVPSAVSGASVGRQTADTERTLAGRRGAVTCASPKSSSFTPAFVSMTLPGLRSRWTMPCAVRLVERVGDLDAEAKHLLEGQRAFRERAVERLALDILHHEVVDAALVADVVERADVRMVESARSSAPRARTAARSSGRREVRRQHLDRDGRGRAACRARGRPRPCRPRRAARRSRKGRGGCRV